VQTVRFALAGATLWSAALVVAALTVPLYSGMSASSFGSASTDSNDMVVPGPVTTTSTTATLVEVNGWWGLAVACIPLCACLMVGTLLLGPGGRRAQVAAAVVVGLLGALTVLSLLSIGLFLVPAVAGLGLAVLVALTVSPSEGPT
jgi:hypothetical protein